jgi:hypothetical protein
MRVRVGALFTAPAAPHARALCQLVAGDVRWAFYKVAIWITPALRALCVRLSMSSAAV